MTDRERWMTTTDPAWMFNVLGDDADERRKLIFDRECEKLYQARAKCPSAVSISWIEFVASLFSIHITGDDSTKIVKPVEACNLIRCLWPSPFSERELESAIYTAEIWLFFGRKITVESENYGEICEKLERLRIDNWPNVSHISPVSAVERFCPLINPRWRTPLVMELARKVRGREAGWYCGNCGRECGTAGFWCFCGNAATRYKSEATPPNPELMPILSDALMDAGCEVPEIIEHLKADCRHMAECWAIGMLLDAGLERERW